jgi:hypothetical protein
MAEAGAVRISPDVRITFGMIVLNGEPFTRYNLRALYPWAHQIVVVEGACRAAAAVADARGHSSDGTLEELRRFCAEEDPDGKITVVTAEDEGHPDGFWPGEKDEMSRAYARRATGDHHWQVDVDEFYREEDMPRILEMLAQGADAVSFPTRSFWGGLQIETDGEYLRCHGARVYHRLFRWGPGYRYTTHRPPTVEDDRGRDLRAGRWVTAAALEGEGIFLYHYCLLLPKQVREKSTYYACVSWADFKDMERWAQETFFELKHPFRVCNVLQVPLSWLQEYRGPHPRQVREMIDDIRAGRHPRIVLRSTDDLLRVTGSPGYRAGRLVRRAWVFHGIPVARAGRRLAGRLLGGTRLESWLKGRRRRTP